MAGQCTVIRYGVGGKIPEPLGLCLLCAMPSPAPHHPSPAVRYRPPSLYSPPVAPHVQEAFRDDPGILHAVKCRPPSLFPPRPICLSS